MNPQIFGAYTVKVIKPFLLKCAAIMSQKLKCWFYEVYSLTVLDEQDGQQLVLFTIQNVCFQRYCKIIADKPLSTKLLSFFLYTV